MNQQLLKPSARWLVSKHYFVKLSPLNASDKRIKRWHKSHSVLPAPTWRSLSLSLSLKPCLRRATCPRLSRWLLDKFRLRDWAMLFRVQSFPFHRAWTFFRIFFGEFPWPAWAVARCCSGPQAGPGNSQNKIRKTSMHDGMENSVEVPWWYKN